MLLHKKLFIIGGAIAASTIVFLFLAFTPILHAGIADQAALRKRNEIRQIYLKLPFPIDFSVYFFNVTNPMEVHNGAKPVLKEVGPYTYDEYVEKVDVVDNEAEDSLSYLPFHTFYFNQEKSGHHSDNDVVTIINPLIVGMVNLVTKESPALLSIINQAIAPLFRNPESIYLTARVKDILFDGMEIDCTSTEFAPKAVCLQLKSQIPGIEKLPDKNVYLFSLMGPRNATTGKRMKVSRGIRSIKELGSVLEYDGKKEINLWNSRECNRFRGTDGWIVPPLLKQEEGIWIYSTDMCRNLHGYYVSDDVIKGVFVNRYEGDLGDMTTNEEERKCYCSTPDTCMRKGVFDVSKCMRVPIYVSLPHFYGTDEYYMNLVEGLQPNKSKHKIVLLLESLTSAPLIAAKRAQLNLLIAPNPKITIMTNLPEALHPIFWMEESIILEGPILKKVQVVGLLLKITNIFRWILLVAGLGIIGFGGYLFIKSKNNSKILHINSAVNGITTVKSAKKIQKPQNGLENGGFEFDDASTKEETDGNKKKGVMTGHEFDRFQ